MPRNGLSSRVSAIVCGAILAFAAASSNAAVVTLVLDTQYTGDQPDGYLVIEFSDEAIGLNAGEVKMTLTGFLEGGEDLKTLAFNFDPGQGDADAGIIAALQFLNESKTFSGTVTIAKEMDALQGDLGPFGGFDILLTFPNANPDRFEATDTLSYTLKSDTLPLLVTMFDAVTPNGYGAVAAAHIRDTDGIFGSGKITTGDDDDDDDDDDETPQIPTPAAMPAGLALLGLASLRRRRNAA